LSDEQKKEMSRCSVLSRSSSIGQSLPLTVLVYYVYKHAVITFTNEVATEPSRRLRYFEATEPSIVLTVPQFWGYAILRLRNRLDGSAGHLRFSRWNIIGSVYVYAVVYWTVKILCTC